MSQSIIVAAYPQRGARNDPEPLGVASLQDTPIIKASELLNMLYKKLKSEKKKNCKTTAVWNFIVQLTLKPIPTCVLI